jgi:hypothetical protein
MIHYLTSLLQNDARYRFSEKPFVPKELLDNFQEATVRSPLYFRYGGGNHILLYWPRSSSSIKPHCGDSLEQSTIVLAS